jgi:AcrR family transcriptional regulator
MSKRPGSNKENLEETRRVFLNVAVDEFCEYGFAQASTSRIVERSGMARGSLYYHFGDKNGLFHDVYEDIMFQYIEGVSEKMDALKDPWESFLAGADAFLDLCMKKDFRKIILIESQGAMTYEQRFAIQGKTLLAKLRELLPDLFARGYFPGHTPETFSIFMFGILGETGRALDFSKNIEQDRKTFGTAFVETMKCLRTSG